MPHSLRGLWLAVALATAWLTAPAVAEVDPGKLLAAQAAATKFIARAKGSETTAPPPRLSEPEVNQLLDTVFDLSDVGAGTTIAAADLGPLGQRMMTGIKVGLVYLLAGTGVTDLAQLGGDQGAADKLNLNAAKFQPEVGRLYDFQMRIQAAIIESALARMAAATPEEQARPNFQGGLAKMREGAAQSVRGVIETLSVNGITDPWRRDRFPALVVIAPKLARFLLPEQKTDLQKLALESARTLTDSQVKQGLQDFANVVVK
jgi:hypothetical protein